LLGLFSEMTVTVTPQQFLTIRYPSETQSGPVRITLTPTVPGVSYGLEGFGDAGFRYDPANFFYKTKVATTGSLEFEDRPPAPKGKRIYRAVREVLQP